MTDDFVLRMRAVVERVAEDHRARVRADLEALERAGADSYERLMQLAQDPRVSTDVRGTACWVLARLGDQRAALILIGLLQDADDSVRGEAARSLGVLGATRAVRPLIRLLQREASARVREAATFSLGLLGDVRALRALTRRLDDPDEHERVRGMAAEALGDLRDGRAGPSLIAALGDPSAVVRFWAAFALGDLKDPRARPALRWLAATDETEVPGWRAVKDEAAAALRRIDEAPALGGDGSSPSDRDGSESE